MPTSVHNLHYEQMQSGDIRIDRRTEFGNLFIIGCDGTREEVIARFEATERARIASNPVRQAKVRAMYGHRLFCWCKPQQCHGDVYVRLAEELNRGDS